MVNWLRSLTCEPLAHFLVAGLILFFILGRSSDSDPAGRTITVSEEQIGRIAANWERTWQRPPTEDELAEQIEDHVREEIYFREAIRLGLDEDDAVIRRRLRAKMEYLTRSEVDTEAPPEAVLQQWLDDHATLYATDAIVSFEQIYLGEDVTAEAVLAQLNGGANPADLGTPLLLPNAVTDANIGQIARQFGERFSRAIDYRRIGDWQGPVESGFGRHLVRVTAHQEGAAPVLVDVRQRVENDWRAATMAAREEQAYADLRATYAIEIERPD